MLGTLLAVDASAFDGVSPSESDRGPRGGHDWTKWRAAREIAVACAAVAHAGGDPVGLAVAGHDGLARLVAAHAPRGRR